MSSRPTTIRVPFTRTIENFFSWWVDNLSDILDGWGGKKRSRILVLKEDSCELYHTVDGVNALHRVDLTSENGRDPKDYTVLRLSGDQVLYQAMKIPRGASDVLEPVVRNQLERVTPWSASELRFGYRITQSEAHDGENVEVETVATSAKLVEVSLARARSLGFEPDYVDFNPDRESDGSISLIGVGIDRQHQHSQRVRRGLIAAASIAAILCAVGMGRLYNSVSKRSGIETELSDARVLVAKIEKQQLQLNELIKQCEELIVERMSKPSTVLVIEALTKALPDGAYLEELTILTDELKLRGHSMDAAALIPLIERSNNFSNVRFAASTTRQRDGTDEKFAISAKLLPADMKVPQ